MNTRRLPSRSAARPPRSRKPPNVSAYALATHCNCRTSKSNDAWIEGNATLTMDTSRTTMNCVAHSSTRASQRRSSDELLIPDLHVVQETEQQFRYNTERSVRLSNGKHHSLHTEIRCTRETSSVA